MGTYNVRLGCQLAFDEEQESDIVDAVKELNSTHKMGQFVSNILRLAFANPEVIEVKNGKVCKGAILKAMDAVGLTYDRHKYMTQVNKELKQMKERIDSIYEMSLKTYNLALMNKYLGIEEKSDNNLRATFILEKQLKEMYNKLGVSTLGQVFVSNKLDRTHDIANDAMEYILESYDGIIQELKKSMESATTMRNMGQAAGVESMGSMEQATGTGNVGNMGQAAGTGNTTSTVNTVIQEKEQTVLNNSPKVQVIPALIPNMEQPIQPNEDDEVIDFGNADLALLQNFFGE